MSCFSGASGDISDADGNLALSAAYPEWFVGGGCAVANGHQRFGRARADVCRSWAHRQPERAVPLSQLHGPTLHRPGFANAVVRPGLPGRGSGRVERPLAAPVAGRPVRRQGRNRKCRKVRSMSASSIDQGESSGVSEAAMRRRWPRPETASRSTEPEAEVLLHASGDDLTALLGYAARTGTPGSRRPAAGVITYSKKVFIPLTRLCRDRCGYCTFATVPGRLDSLYLSPDEVLEIAREGARSAARKPSSPSATAPRPAGSRPASGWTRTATRTRSPTSGPWRSASSRRPACCRTSTRA